jgi:RNA-binding protein
MGSELSSAQRARLRALAHHREPLVHVGQRGVTDAVARGLEEALQAHELIKVKLVGHREERRAMAADLAERAGAFLVGLIGGVAIVYRPHADPEKRKIALD